MWSDAIEEQAQQSPGVVLDVRHECGRWYDAFLLSIPSSREETIMRIAIAGIQHETNTFNPQLTDLGAFTIKREREILEDDAVKPALNGGLDVRPILVADAIPSGPVFIFLSLPPIFIRFANGWLLKES